MSDEIRNADETLTAYMPAAIGQSIANASDLLNRTFTTSPCTTSVDIPGNENTSLRRVSDLVHIAGAFLS